MTLIVYYQQVEPELVECVGTPSVIIPDQRLSAMTIIDKVIKRDYVRPNNTIGFCIAKGTVLEHTPITEPILFVKQQKD